MQLQLVQPELHHLTGQFGRYPVRWEQGNLPGLGIPFLERRQRLTPRGLLHVIDLARVQHRPLDHLLIGSPVVFHDAILAALLNQTPLPHGRLIPEPWPTRPSPYQQETTSAIVALLQAA